VIRNLPSSTKVEDISITAVNQADLKGKRATVSWGEQVNVTQPCSRFYQLQQEIQRTSNHVGDFIDSDFYTVLIPPPPLAPPPSPPFPYGSHLLPPSLPPSLLSRSSLSSQRVLHKNFIKKNILKN
jgi:hypothetical protein